MWKSDDEESNLLESVVNWASPNPPTPLTTSSTTLAKNNLSTSSNNFNSQLPPLPPPSPFSELFPQELLQSSGLLLSQFDDDGINSNSNDHHVDDSMRNQSMDYHRHSSSSSTISTVSNGSYRCTECKFSTDDRRLFMCHKRSKHAGEKTFSCPNCSAKFTRQYSMKKHVLQKHPTTTTTVANASLSQLLPKYCPFPNCKYATRNSNSMQLHKRTHQQLYFCKECNARYTRRQSLLGHLTKHHGSNAALIGMRPSPAIVNAIDEQSLQSPPPQSTSTSSSTSTYFQQNHTIMTKNEIESPDVLQEEIDDDESSSTIPISTEEHQSACAETELVSSQFNQMDAQLESINAVVGLVASTTTEDSTLEGPADTKFICDKCQFTANSLRRLYGHKLSSHRSAKEKMIAKTNHHICPHCPKKFASLKRMMTHVKKIHTATIKKGKKRAPKTGGKQRRQQTKRRPSLGELACNRCDFITSRKRIYAAHMKSHLTENLERVQDNKYDLQIRKPNPIIINKNFSPDRNLMDLASASTLPLTNSPSYTSAVSPGTYDFYHNGAGARFTSSGSSTHSTGSHCIENTSSIATTNNNCNFGQFIVVNRNSGPSSSTNSFSSENNRSIRLDLNNQNSSNGFEEMATCLQGLQQANGALMQLVKRKDNDLRSLRTNVVELIRLLLPNHQAFQHVLNLDNVDELVTNTLNRVLTDAALQK